ncbi:calcium-binding protein, partial [Phenylobacterium aquaticum]|uniref:calcium-binding protein n=1 Tax=Phenylobacterium aquaticum TaxID=1763816 RepID=UPI003AFACF3D|nr:calcium-binding protein [Phenylobacterium aquaticum]
MAVITAGAIALNFDQLDLSSLIAGTVTVANNGQISTSDSGIVDSFFGSFQYNGSGALSGGTMTHLSETYLGQTVFDIAGVNVPVTTFLTWALSNDNASAKAYILAGADQITGSTVGDLLRGLTGNDSISGGAGNDTLDGGSGDDSVFGGTGDDIILDASGSNYLRGDDGNDQVSGGSGFDDINGNAGNDTAHGNLGDDWVVGGKD